MRKLHLRLNQTQKVRYDRAMERLESLSSTAENYVTLSSSIPFNHEEGVILRGNGVSQKGELEATVCGVVERVNNYVKVCHLRARYTPVDSDTVVGRVIEVAEDKLWKVEINASRNGVLMLNSMNTNSDVQKRKRSEDKLNLRVAEHDIVCAKVCMNNGWVELKADISNKYGKLEKGQLLKVNLYLVKRSASHIHYLENLGINLILGLNGFIWVRECIQVRDPMILDQISMMRCSTTNIGKEQTYTPFETRRSICIATNAIRVLSNLGFTIT